jgi:hypothetical protein
MAMGEKIFSRLTALALLLTTTMFATAQSQEAEQLLLNVEKLAQLKKILSNMEKGYQVISSGYNRIKDFSKGNFDLHTMFLDGLLAVNPSVRNYRKVAVIVSTQQSLLRECARASSEFARNRLFTVKEINYIKDVYQGVLDQSLKNLEEFVMIMTSGKLRMNDAERLEAIDRIHDNMQDKLSFLRSFNNNTRLLGARRKLQQNDIDRSRKNYGLVP